MSIEESQLLSKIVDENSVDKFEEYGLTSDYFSTEITRNTYEFVRKYRTEHGQAPSYATVVANVPEFDYIPNVTDTYEYLAGKLKETYGKREIAKLFSSGEIEKMFESIGKVSNIDEFFTGLSERLEKIKMGSYVRKKIGTDLAELSTNFRKEYESRREGKSFKLWETPFESLNREVGGLYSGDVYGIMAESGRGKTYLSEVFIDWLLRQGARVLVKSYEVKAYPWLSRLLSIISAVEGALTHEELAIKVGLPNKALLAGKLEGDVETYMFDIVSRLNEYYPGKLYLQAKSDEGLTRSLDDLNRELLSEEIDVVVIDAFYNLDDCYGHNANKTAGGAAERAARRLEQIIGEHDVVCIYTVQAHTERKEYDDDSGEREVKLPDRDRMKTTKALLEITTNLFTFDAANGNGKLGVDKGRNGGEGFTLDLLALMDYGVLREMPTGEVAAQQFTTVF